MRTRNTPRLALRAFAQEDFSSVHAYAGSRENTLYMPWGPNTPEQTREFIDAAMALSHQVPCTNYQYAAVRTDTGKLIGACNLARRGEEEGEIGWIVHRDGWGQGYATEMGQELLRLGFDELGLHRIIARCDAENTASYRVMEKIGMRREGVLIEGRPGNKTSDAPYADELQYALTRGEWETGREIAHYRALPVTFEGFVDVPTLSDGEVYLVCLQKREAIPEKKFVPAYHFAICAGGEKVGEIDLRVGYRGFGPDESSLYYGGQIGYNVDEKYRGRGYAGRACKLLAPVARAHGMGVLLITNHHKNTASRRVCEKLGARLLRKARLPEWIDQYSAGHRYMNVFEWTPPGAR